jgi:pimeloyl-ACP methyl ester carboxylesterase
MAAGMYYSVSGGDLPKSPALVLVHGAGSNHLIWPPELRRLSGYRVFALDLPGHGSSSGSAEQSIEVLAGHLKSFIEAVELYQPVVVGHSMGGAIALKLTLMDPEMVSGVGLVASGAFLGGETDIQENLSTPATVPKALQLIRQRIFSTTTDPSLVKKVMAVLEETRPGVLYNDWRACTDFDMRSQVHLISKPVRIWVGSEDRLTPVSYANFLVSNMPDARLQVTEGAGHMLVLEAPGVISHGLEDFLEQLSSNM